MNKTFKAILSFAASAVLLLGTASAQTLSFDGTVKPAVTCEVYAPLGGTIDQVTVKPGQTVAAGDTLATLRTVKTYAAADGTVTAVFGQPGDNAALVTERFGAVLYVEGAVKYTLTCNINNAYSAVDTTFVHAGQVVYLRSKNNTDRVGKGVITAVDTGSYTVEVVEGDFIVGETVSVFQDTSYKDTVRLGRGSATRRVPTAATVEAGTLVNVAVASGDAVKRGDLLFETLSGTAEGCAVNGNAIAAPVSGVVAGVSVAQADAVEKDAVVAVIYPADAMQIEGLVAESDLSGIAVGAKVKVTLAWNEDSDTAYDGEIAWISSVADPDAAETSYNVCVKFTPDASVRYGMNATIEVAGK